LIKKALPYVIMTLITVVLLELISFYIYEKKIGKGLLQKFANGKVIVEYNLNKDDSEQSIIPHPYLLYDNKDNYIYKETRQHSAEGGFRDSKENIALKKDPTKTRIIALGGSTTYMFPYIKNPNNAWPKLLEKKLNNENLNEKYEVLNAGKLYATSAELLSEYIYRYQYYNPDILIIHTGGNDVTPLMFPDYNPEYSHFRSHGKGLDLRPSEAILLNSNFMKLFYSIWLHQQESIYQSQPYGMDKLDRDTINEVVTKNESLGFKRNLETIIRLAKINNTQVVLFGFIQAKDEFLSKGRDDLKGLEKAMSIGLAKHYKIMDELAKKYDNVIFIPLDNNDFKDKWFIDNCHLNEKGDEKKSDILIEQLNNNGLI